MPHCAADVPPLHSYPPAGFDALLQEVLLGYCMISNKPTFRFLVLVLLATAARAQSPPAAQAPASAATLRQRMATFLDPGTGA